MGSDQGDTPSKVHVVLAVVLALGGIVGTLDAWRDILLVASHDAASFYIFVVPALSLWLIWARRYRFRGCRRRNTWVGPLLLCSGWVLYSFGQDGLVPFSFHSGAFLIVLGCFLAPLGSDVVQRFLPALFVLGFVVPVPTMLRVEMMLLLEWVTAPLSEAAFRLLRLPFELSGTLIRDSGSTAISQGAYGVTMAFLFLLVSFAFVFAKPYRNKVRLLILSTVLLSVVLGNSIRHLVTAELGQWNTAGVLLLHVTVWALLCAQFVVLRWTLAVFRWASIPLTRYRLAYG